jgi:hypothetical protein
MMKSRNLITRAIPGFVAVAGLGLSLNAFALTFKNIDSRDAIDVHFQYILRGVTKDFDKDVITLSEKTFFISEGELSKGYVDGSFEFSYATEPKRVKGKSVNVPESLNSLGVLLISFVSLLVVKLKSL